MRNLQVTDPTTSTLNVRWEPPEGNVREYIVIWVPAAGGEQDVVRIHHVEHDSLTPVRIRFLMKTCCCGAADLSFGFRLRTAGPVKCD